MSKKLLNKTLGTNLVFSVIVLLIAAPLFYFATERLYLEETDETLLLKKNELLNSFKSQLKEKDIQLWNRINSNVRIRHNEKGIGRDTFFYATIFDSNAMDSEYCRVLQSPVKIDNNDYLLEARVSLVESEDLLKNIVWLFLGIILILLIGFYFITRMRSKRLWQPFYDTLDKIEQFEIDKNLSPDFDLTDIEEFKRLNQSIAKLVEKNTTIFKSQREFVENAAHELQTPLAIFQAKIDTLIQRPDITEEQAEILDQLNDATARLNKLNKNLLLLSKIESKQFSETQTINLNDIFNRQVPFFKEQAESKKIAIDLRMNETTILQSNQVMAEVLINNLFLNAIRHNIENGLIQIKFTAKSLVFSNTGTAQALNKDSLFQRFAKVNPSSSGNGLGLAIVRKIADNNGWTISYRFENNLHVFEILF